MFKKWLPKCVVCGFPVEEYEAVIYDDEIYCYSCFHENYKECECCGEYFNEDDLYEAYDEEKDLLVCENCLDEYFDKCKECECYVLKELIDKETGLCNECIKYMEE